jgi:large subunit ribosomal protein L9
MKVILLQELRGRGGEGDVVEVARGFAVNYLFPQNIAIEATKGNLKQLELRKHNIAKREAGRLDTADKLFNALNEQRVVIAARVGEEGQLFGSVTAQQIADAISAHFGVDIDRKKIDLRTAIKTAGDHSVAVSIYRDVKAVVIIEVVDEKVLEQQATAAAAAEAPVEEAVEAVETTEGALEEAEGAQDAVVADAVEEVVEEQLEEAGTTED